MPRKLPVSLPSSLVRQRPDIRQAEATLHQATATVGVGIANLLPQVTLSGSYGASGPERLFSPTTLVWEAAASVSQKLIDADQVAPSSVGPIFDKLMEEDAPAEQIAKALNLIQTSDSGETDAAIDEVLAKNPPALQDYRAGKQAAMGALVGMIMKSRKGLNPRMVQERLRQKLSG